MNFVKYTLDSFGSTCKRITDFNSRANRKEYLIFSLMLLFLSIFKYSILVLLKKIGIKYLSCDLIILLIILRLLLFIIGLSLSIRRVHDFDVSSWWLILYIIVTFLTFLYFVGKNDGFSLTSKVVGYGSLVTLKLFLIFKKGTSGTNKYGEEPIN